MTEKDKTSLVDQVENWGFYVLPKSHPNSPGHSGLLVAIRETPTRMHFDPETVCLQTVNQDGSPHWRTYRIGPPLARSVRVCPTDVRVFDRLSKEIEFFTFGGSLDSVSVPGETVYSLRSPVPVLQLTNMSGSLPNQLASETEALVAELRAKEADEQDFTRRLSRVDPFQFYVATLRTILASYRRSPSLRESFKDLYTMLLEEEFWLEAAFDLSSEPSSVKQLLSSRPSVEPG